MIAPRFALRGKLSDTTSQNFENVFIDFYENEMKCICDNLNFEGTSLWQNMQILESSYFPEEKGSDVIKVVQIDSIDHKTWTFRENDVISNGNSFEDFLDALAVFKNEKASEILKEGSESLTGKFVGELVTDFDFLTLACEAADVSSSLPLIGAAFKGIAVILKSIEKSKEAREKARQIANTLRYFNRYISLLPNTWQYQKHLLSMVKQIQAIQQFNEATATNVKTWNGSKVKDKLNEIDSFIRSLTVIVSGTYAAIAFPSLERQILRENAKINCTLEKFIKDFPTIVKAMKPEESTSMIVNNVGYGFVPAKGWRKVENDDDEVSDYTKFINENAFNPSEMRKRRNILITNGPGKDVNAATASILADMKWDLVVDLDEAPRPTPLFKSFKWRSGSTNRVANPFDAAIDNDGPEKEKETRFSDQLKEEFSTHDGVKWLSVANRSHDKFGRWKKYCFKPILIPYLNQFWNMMCNFGSEKTPHHILMTFISETAIKEMLSVATELSEQLNNRSGNQFILHIYSATPAIKSKVEEILSDYTLCEEIVTTFRFHWFESIARLTEEESLDFIQRGSQSVKMPSSNRRDGIKTLYRKDQLTFASLLELVHLDVHDDSPSEITDEEQQKYDYFSGADVTWRNISLHHPISRDNVYIILGSRLGADKASMDTIKTYLLEKARNASKFEFLQIFHRPCAGGTTLAKQLLFDMRVFFPCVVVKDPAGSSFPTLYSRLSELYSKCNKTIISFWDDDIDSVKSFRDYLSSLSKEDTSPLKLLILSCSRTVNTLESFQHEGKAGDMYLGDVSEDESKQLFDKMNSLDHSKGEAADDFMAMPPKNMALFGLLGLVGNKDRIKSFTKRVCELIHKSDTEGMLQLFFAISCILYLHSGKNSMPNHVLRAVCFPTRGKPGIILKLKDILQSNLYEGMDLLFCVSRAHRWRPRHKLVADAILIHLQNQGFGQPRNVINSLLKPFESPEIREPVEQGLLYLLDNLLLDRRNQSTAKMRSSNFIEIVRKDNDLGILEACRILLLVAEKEEVLDKSMRARCFDAVSRLLPHLPSPSVEKFKIALMASEKAEKLIDDEDNHLLSTIQVAKGFVYRMWMVWSFQKAVQESTEALTKSVAEPIITSFDEKISEALSELDAESITGLDTEGEVLLAPYYSSEEEKENDDDDDELVLAEYHDTGSDNIEVAKALEIVMKEHQNATRLLDESCACYQKAVKSYEGNFYGYIGEVQAHHQYLKQVMDGLRALTHTGVKLLDLDNKFLTTSQNEILRISDRVDVQLDLQSCRTAESKRVDRLETHKYALKYRTKLFYMQGGPDALKEFLAKRLKTPNLNAAIKVDLQARYLLVAVPKQTNIAAPNLKLIPQFQDVIRPIVTQLHAGGYQAPSEFPRYLRCFMRHLRQCTYVEIKGYVEFLRKNLKEWMQCWATFRESSMESVDEASTKNLEAFMYLYILEFPIHTDPSSNEPMTILRTMSDAVSLSECVRKAKSVCREAIAKGKCGKPASLKPRWFVGKNASVTSYFASLVSLSESADTVDEFWTKTAPTLYKQFKGEVISIETTASGKIATISVYGGANVTGSLFSAALAISYGDKVICSIGFTYSGPFAYGIQLYENAPQNSPIESVFVLMPFDNPSQIVNNNKPSDFKTKFQNNDFVRALAEYCVAFLSENLQSEKAKEFEGNLRNNLTKNFSSEDWKSFLIHVETYWAFGVSKRRFKRELLDTIFFLLLPGLILPQQSFTEFYHDAIENGTHARWPTFSFTVYDFVRQTGIVHSYKHRTCYVYGFSSDKMYKWDYVSAFPQFTTLSFYVAHGTVHSPTPELTDIWQVKCRDGVGTVTKSFNSKEGSDSFGLIFVEGYQGVKFRTFDADNGNSPPSNMINTEVSQMCFRLELLEPNDEVQCTVLKTNNGDFIAANIVSRKWHQENVHFGRLIQLADAKGRFTLTEILPKRGSKKYPFFSTNCIMDSRNLRKDQILCYTVHEYAEGQFGATRIMEPDVDSDFDLPIEFLIQFCPDGQNVGVYYDEKKKLLRSFPRQRKREYEKLTKELASDMEESCNLKDTISEMETKQQVQGDSLTKEKSKKLANVLNRKQDRLEQVERNVAAREKKLEHLKGRKYEKDYAASLVVDARKEWEMQERRRSKSSYV